MLRAEIAPALGGKLDHLDDHGVDRLASRGVGHLPMVREAGDGFAGSEKPEDAGCVIATIYRDV